MSRETVRKAWIFRSRVFAFTKSGKYRHPHKDNVEVLLQRIEKAGSIDPKHWEPVVEKKAAKDRTEAEAAEYGKRTGRCGVCHRKLTDPVSIEAGIGPICRGKFK